MFNYEIMTAKCLGILTFSGKLKSQFSRVSNGDICHNQRCT